MFIAPQILVNETLKIFIHKYQKVSAPAALTLFAVLLLAAEPLGEILAVPHQQLLLGLHGPDRVEVDVQAVLARHQVLFGQRAGRVDVAHPVASVDVIAINEVLKLPTAVNLEKRRKRRRE